MDDHETRLRALEANMGEIIPWMERVDGDLYNHGQDGLKTQFTKFMTRQNTLESEQKDRHVENRHRINLIIALLMLLIALVGLAPVLKTVFKTSVDYLPHLLSHHAERAETTQDARY